MEEYARRDMWEECRQNFFPAVTGRIGLLNTKPPEKLIGSTGWDNDWEQVVEENLSGPLNDNCSLIQFNDFVMMEEHPLWDVIPQGNPYGWDDLYHGLGEIDDPAFIILFLVNFVQIVSRDDDPEAVYEALMQDTLWSDIKYPSIRQSTPNLEWVVFKLESIGWHDAVNWLLITIHDAPYDILNFHYDDGQQWDPGDLDPSVRNYISWREYEKKVKEYLEPASRFWDRIHADPHVIRVLIRLIHRAYRIPKE